MPRRIFITVAEVSADHHAAELIRALKDLDPTIQCEGLGGSAMRAAGATIHHETVARAVMLVRAVIRSFEIYKLLRWTRRLYLQSPPDLHICIDSSGMNLHFAKMARSCGVPVLYYIAPQLWASREGRIEKVRRFVNRVACILPFEEDYYRRHAVSATFVGHPLFDGLPPNRQLSPEPRDFTESSPSPGTPGEGQGGGPPVSIAPPTIGIMPGSRRAEIRANFPHLIDVANQIKAAFPNARFEIPTTPPTDTLVRQFAANRPDFRIEQGAIDAMAPHWDFCLAKSGTTTLHVAAYGVPMIVVYRLTWLAWNAVGRWIVKTPSYALVNILAERSPANSPVPKYRIVPEIIPWLGSNTPVANLAIEFLKNPAKRLEQRTDLLNLVATLDRRGASKKVAEIAIEMMNAAPRIPQP